MSLIKSIMDGFRISGSRRSSANDMSSSSGTLQNIPEVSSSKSLSSNKTVMEAYSFKPFAFQELKCSSNASMPRPRSGHRIVCHQGHFYSFGGYLEINDAHPSIDDSLVPGSQQLFQELWKYNISSQTWELLPIEGQIPKELASHSAIVHGDYMVTFGGTAIPFGGSSSNKMSVCDLRTLKFQRIETQGESPYPQYGQAIVLDKDGRNLYVIGGTTGVLYSMDVHRLDLKNFTWEPLFIHGGGGEDEGAPPPRYRHEVAFDDGKIYILGGGTATSAYPMKTIPTFNVNSKKWSSVSTIGDPSVTPGYPAARKCLGSVQREKDIYICGGFGKNKYIYDDLWKLNLKSLQWTKLKVQVPIKVYFHSSAITTSGCMFMFGGVTNPNQPTRRTNRAFKIWLNVPSLKEMAFEAVTHYQPQLQSKSEQSLLEAGIPRDFVNRLRPAINIVQIPAPPS